MSRLSALCIVGCVFLSSWLACTGKSSIAGPSSGYQVGAAGNFAKIQDAVNAAPANSVVEVFAGTYVERVVVNKPLKLRGSNAVVDGAGIGGTGIGILVTNTSGVDVSGFTVQNFERGIVLQNVSNSTLKSNEVRNSTAKGGGTITIGVTPFEGIVLIASRGNEVTDNFSHDNGHDGLMITEGSSGNRVRNNRFTDNGAQTPTSVG